MRFLRQSVFWAGPRCRLALVVIAVAVLGAACGRSASDGSDAGVPSSGEERSRAAYAQLDGDSPVDGKVGGTTDSDVEPPPPTGPVAGPAFAVARPPDDLYDPFAAGEPAPPGYRQLLRRDRIFPVYDPSFVRRDQVDWGPETLVIGVDLGGEARAYPVGFLNRREIVVDMHRGIPTLVTW